jgi:hypothetical protein
MPTEVLSIGPVHQLVQNQVYALPARAVTISSSAALDVSNNFAFTTNGTVAANTPTKAVAGFVRCTASTNALAVLKVD